MKRRTSPAREARQNAYRYFSFSETAEIFGFGVNVVTKLVAMGAPVVARKCNPDHLKRWLEENGDAVGKIRTEGATK